MRSGQAGVQVKVPWREQEEQEEQEEWGKLGGEVTS